MSTPRAAPSDGTRIELVYDGFARRLEKRVVRRDAALVRHRYRWDGEDLLEETVERKASTPGAAASFTLVKRRRPEPLGLLGGLESYGYVNGKPLVWIDRDGLARSVTTLTDHAPRIPSSRDLRCLSTILPSSAMRRGWSPRGSFSASVTTTERRARS